MLGDILGWVAWAFMAIPGLVLIYGAISDAIIDYRWRRALKRGEIKPHPFREKVRAEYLGAPRMGTNR